MDLKEKKYIRFWVNNEEINVDCNDVTPDVSLNSCLRNKLHLTGTKKMCLEGGCGVCVVNCFRMNPTTKSQEIYSINSCLVSIFSCVGWRIYTIEGIKKCLNNQYHPLQTSLVEYNGSQCGFCTSGMIMTALPLYENNRFTPENIESSLGGNLCRCTGYRAILTGFKSNCKNIADIEDTQKCFKSCKNSSCEEKAPIYFNLKNVLWIKAYAVDDILKVLKQFEGAIYMLVAGNTIKGIYKKKESINLYVDVTDVKELSEYKTEDESITIGANTTITESTEILQNILDMSKKYSEKYWYFKKIIEHFNLVAHVSVRNIGTIAGNLMTKHKNKEFTSDIFLILEAVGANLLLVDVGKKHYIKTPTEFLNFDMNSKIIYQIIFYPWRNNCYFDSYKIMPRAQNAYALLNAAFFFELNSDQTIKSSKIVYGFINKNKTRATATEAFLKDRNIFENDQLQLALKELDKELQEFSVIGMTPVSYRQKLGVSLFFKFILSICPSNKIDPKNVSGGAKLLRPISHGIQDFETKKSLYPVSQTISKVEGMAQVSGTAQYIMDMPDLPNQRYVAFVLSEAPPHSIIEKINIEKALELKGVEAFFDKNDIPGQNTFTPTATAHFIQEEIFCDGTIKYFNQPIGIVVADSQENAEKAASLVDVTYKESIKKPIYTVKHILQENATDRIENYFTQKVDPVGIEPGYQTIEGSLSMGMQNHFHMETHCCNVVPTEDGYDMYPSTQYLDLSHVSASTTLGLPASKFNVSVRRLGGGFGGKISRNGQISCAAVLACHKIQKPVKFWLPLELNLSIIGRRGQLSSTYKATVDNGGIIRHMDIKIYSDYAYGGNEPNLMLLLFMLNTNYDTTCWNIDANVTHTDNPSTCWIRAPGNAEGFLLGESIMEHLAVSIEMDPLEFRIKNFKDKHPELLRHVMDFKQWANLDARKDDIKNFNMENRWRKRGISVLPMEYEFGIYANYGVIVSIYQSDGSVSVAHGGIEMGQGINTKVAQVCAYKLGIPLEKISVKPSNNLIAPNSHWSGASLTSESVCYGVIKACDKLLKRIEPYREELESPTWEELIKKCHQKHVNLCANSMSSPKDATEPNAKLSATYTVYAVAASEVEVDVLTGQYVIRRVDLLEDAGDSLNPKIDVGQIEGAFVMGLGYCTTEEIKHGEDGRILNANTWSYKPPGAQDIPVDFRIKIPKNNPHPGGVLKSKTTGEPAVCLAASVPLAIRNALISVRKNADPKESPWYFIDGPSTVENTFLNCLHNYTQYHQ